MGQTSVSKAASLMGQLSYRARLKRLGIERIRAIARQNGKKAADRLKRKRECNDLPAGKKELLVRFRFAGRFFHESARTVSKTLAREAERQRRRELEKNWNRIDKRSLPPTFTEALSAGLRSERAWLLIRSKLTWGTETCPGVPRNQAGLQKSKREILLVTRRLVSRSGPLRHN